MTWYLTGLVYGSILPSFHRILPCLNAIATSLGMYIDG